jgi:hypothetical protein
MNKASIESFCDLSSTDQMSVAKEEGLAVSQILDLAEKVNDKTDLEVIFLISQQKAIFKRLNRKESTPRVEHSRRKTDIPDPHNWKSAPPNLGVGYNYD